jgi:hypothetical protein
MVIDGFWSQGRDALRSLRFACRSSPGRELRAHTPLSARDCVVSLSKARERFIVRPELAACVRPLRPPPVLQVAAAS